MTTLLARLHALLVWVVLLPVVVYRRVLSPMKRVPTCRFAPTCSQYALDAVKQRGIVVGVPLAVWRVLRCNPFGGSGYDPVPPRCCESHAPFGAAHAPDAPKEG